MKQHVVTGLMTGLLICTGAADAQERRYTLLDRELEYLMEVWPGDYNNREQV